VSTEGSILDEALDWLMLNLTKEEVPNQYRAQAKERADASSIGVLHEAKSHAATSEQPRKPVRATPTCRLIVS